MIVSYVGETICPPSGNQFVTLAISVQGEQAAHADNRQLIRAMETGVKNMDFQIKP